MLAVVHRPDDDDLLQALGGRGRRPQLLHQSVEGVRVDGLLLVGFEGHLFGGGVDGRGGALDGGFDDFSGVAVCGGRCGFGVGGGRLGVGGLAFGDGSHTFVFLREFALDKRHGMTGRQEDDCSHTKQEVLT